jgi:polyhydroxybutyrate depolymerase
MEKIMNCNRFIAITCLATALTLLPQMTYSKILPAPPTAEDIAALGLVEKNIVVKGTERWFLVQPPRDASRAAAILVVLHGGSQSMRRLFAKNAGATRAWPELARRENVVLLVPNAANAASGDAKSDDQNWNDLRHEMTRESSADDVGFLLALLDWAAQNYNTDQARVYITGASNGGIMTFRMLMEASGRFAAGAAFVATLPADDTNFTKPEKPTPLLIVNGTRDPLMLWDGGKIAGGRGTTRSVADTRSWWVKANGAGPEPAELIQLPDRDPDDNCTIEKSTYTAANDGAPVVTYTMKGGGHSIPSAKYKLPDNWVIRRFIGPVCRDIEGVELVWSFLSTYKLDRQ